MTPTGNLSWLSADSYVSDGGLETDLIFNRGIDLPEFASFPLVEDDRGRELLRAYYDGYAAVDRVNRAAIAFLDGLRESYSDLEDVRIIGAIGPRGDGYVAGDEVDPDE